MGLGLIPFRQFKPLTSVLSIVAMLCLISARLSAAPIPVTQKDGAIHALLLLRDGDDKEIALGDQTQVVRRDIVHSRLIFRFKDGSVDDVTTVFRQGAVFQLMSYHEIQEGPSFPKPADVSIDIPKGQVSWVDFSHNQKQTKTQHMNLPSDLANGMFSQVIENFPGKTAEMDVSFLAVESKPRVVKLIFKRIGTDKAEVGFGSQPVRKYNLHFDIGGIAGAVAPVIGKQPPDLQFWTLDGEVATFVRMVGPLYEGGPIWSMTLVAPKWPQ